MNRLVDREPVLAFVDGRAVEIVMVGAGGPLIVLESGLGDDWTSWSAVLDGLGARSRILAYNRPGYGRSEPAAGRRDIATEAHELRALLAALGEEPPFLLVGHSLGGMIVKACAAAFPGDVAGLVVLDAPPPDHLEHVRREQTSAGEAYRTFERGLIGAPRAESEALTAPGGGRFAEPGGPYAGPMIILAAWRDRFGSSAYQDRRRELLLEEAARYPQAEVRKIDCGHRIQHERPQAILDAVDALLTRLRNAPAHQCEDMPTGTPKHV